MNEVSIGLDLSKVGNEGNFRQRAFSWLLENEIDVSGRQVVDLGAGPCKFALIARRYGADVTAVDARTVRVPDGLEDEGIRFVEGDVRSFDLSSFGVAMIFGLLYHFDIEDQIGLLERCRGRTVLIDTMVGCPDLLTRYPPHAWQSRLQTRGEYEGVLYPEKDNPMASVGNAVSFWHTERSYMKLFSDCGFEPGCISAYRPRYLASNGLRSFYGLFPSAPGSPGRKRAVSLRRRTARALRSFRRKWR